MPITIKLKRGLKSGLPAEAPLAEPLLAFDGENVELYTGMGPGQPIKQIAGAKELPTGSHGDILVRGSQGWEILAAGQVGKFLQTLGANQKPVWATVEHGTELPDGSPGDILIQGPDSWVILPAGTSGYYLQTKGPGQLPEWAPATGAELSLSQRTKLGITASPESPEIVEIAIPHTTSFKRLPLEVLKLIPGDTNVVQTLCEFDNSCADSFDADDQVIFDGSMKLKTSYTTPMTDEGELGDGRLWSASIDRAAFKTIEKIEVV